MDVKPTWFLHGIKCTIFHCHLDYFQESSLGGKLNIKPRDHDIPNAHNGWFISFYHVWGPALIDIHWNGTWLNAWSYMASHYTWGSVTTLSYMIVEVCWDSLWTLSCGLSQFHGHNSWLVLWSGPKWPIHFHKWLALGDYTLIHYPLEPQGSHFSQEAPSDQNLLPIHHLLYLVSLTIWNWASL